MDSGSLDFLIADEHRMDSGSELSIYSACAHDQVQDFTTRNMRSQNELGAASIISQTRMLNLRLEHWNSSCQTSMFKFHSGHSEDVSTIRGTHVALANVANGPSDP